MSGCLQKTQIRGLWVGGEGVRAPKTAFLKIAPETKNLAKSGLEGGGGRAPKSAKSGFAAHGDVH